MFHTVLVNIIYVLNVFASMWSLIFCMVKEMYEYKYFHMKNLI